MFTYVCRNMDCRWSLSILLHHSSLVFLSPSWVLLSCSNIRAFHTACGQWPFELRKVKLPTSAAIFHTLLTHSQCRPSYVQQRMCVEIALFCRYLILHRERTVFTACVNP
ncbi:hypothetical protein ANANG_G00087360 [Anguilla anguilla]|uniref:Uncharacterized protein n=1 Tax=Anguilla anguilla TaxID=7936 RepID=A0A9D3ML81_ANGAN|nr:hypothetical protein ANANG_G00087360 [Anguilla anguilla]